MPRTSLWLTALFIATLALGTDEFVIAGVLNRVAADLNTTPGTAGQLVTGFALAFALGAPVLAVWLDRFPRKGVLVAALAVFVLANMGCAFAPSLPGLLTLRIVAGLSAAAVSTTAFAVAAQGAPDGKQGSFLSVVTAGLTVALFTGVPVGTWLAGVFSWRSTFVLIAAVAALATVIALVSVPRLPGATAGTLADRLAPLKNPHVTRMVIAIFLCGAGGLMFYSYLGPITLSFLGDDKLLALLLLLVGIVGVVSALLGGRLADGIGPRRARLAILGGHALALALIAVLGVLDTPAWLLAIAVGIWAIFAWALNPPMQASTIAAAPDAAMTAVSLNISGLYFGTAVAGALGGALLDHVGADIIPLAGALLLTVAWFVAAPAVSTPTHDLADGRPTRS